MTFGALCEKYPEPELIFAESSLERSGVPGTVPTTGEDIRRAGYCPGLIRDYCLGTRMRRAKRVVSWPERCGGFKVAAATEAKMGGFV